MVLGFFRDLENLLQQEKTAVIMVVIQNRGSSPGRKGFKMAVTASNMIGSVGGGNMEFRLVEFCRELLKTGSFSPFIKKQIHRKNAGAQHSGLICSGEQTVAFYLCDERNHPEIQKIASGRRGAVCFDENGFSFVESDLDRSEFFSIDIGKRRLR
jgi:xanthine dehydrogenase accessory factor